MPLTNDSICDAETLPVDGIAYAFNNTGATVESLDVDVAPPSTGANTTTGWINNFMNNTTWFKFIAPPSGDIRINGTAINFNGQIAVYSPNSCSSIIANDLEGANDDAIGSTSVAPNFTICNLVPGQEYYLLHDGFAAPGIYSISLSEIILNAGTTSGIVNVCYGDTANLFDGISNYQTGGTWTQQIPTLGLQDSLFATLGLASSIYPFTYTLTDGCATDNQLMQVEIYSPSTAGNDGSLSVCLNEPFNLLSGLVGNVDFGGSWINPQNITLPSSIDTAASIGGQFNYSYIVSNGVCPADTSNILVIVDPSCNYLASLGELQGSLLIYPNPTSNELTLDFGMNATEIDYILYDINGKIVLAENKISIENGKYIVRTSGILPGMYMLHINSKENNQVYRIIKN
jgi:hypothetical protein